MRIGELRHRVTIQSATETQDSYGQAVLSFSTLATRWASIEQLSGREFFDASKVAAEVTHRVRIRYMTGITPKMRVVYGSRTFEIVAITNPEERNIALDLLCKEAS